MPLEPSGGFALALPRPRPAQSSGPTCRTPPSRAARDRHPEPPLRRARAACAPRRYERRGSRSTRGSHCVCAGDGFTNRHGTAVLFVKSPCPRSCPHPKAPTPPHPHPPIRPRVCRWQGPPAVCPAPHRRHGEGGAGWRPRPRCRALCRNARFCIPCRPSTSAIRAAASSPNPDFPCCSARRAPDSAPDIQYTSWVKFGLPRWPVCEPIARPSQSR